MSENQSALSARLCETLTDLDLDPNHLTNANLHLTRDLLAALQLGDLKLVSNDLDWARGLLQNYGIADTALDQYLAAYQRTLSDVMGVKAEPVIAFLQDRMGSTEPKANGKQG